jgi:hypothetical protein
MNNYVAYSPSTVHQSIMESDNVKGWVEARFFLECYRELSEETQNGIDTIISTLTTRHNLGIMSAAELVWWYLKNEKEYRRNEHQIKTKPASIETIRKE